MPDGERLKIRSALEFTVDSEEHRTVFAENNGGHAVVKGILDDLKDTVDEYLQDVLGGGGVSVGGE